MYSPFNLYLAPFNCTNKATMTCEQKLSVACHACMLCAQRSVRGQTSDGPVISLTSLLVSAVST
jgi:hypothetical protein